MRFHDLTESEKKIIIDKGTEPAGTGRFVCNMEPGVYICRRCDAPLYISEFKFDAGCGWPSFDDEFPGVIIREPDPDGIRTEILCSRCKGHLGHVFHGEGYTAKNLRHCVNSVSLEFVPARNSQGHERAIFSGGNFWGLAAFMKDIEGVTEVVTGFTGGHTVLPNYDGVMEGENGHAFAVSLYFDPERTDYRKIAQRFFEVHDPSPEAAEAQKGQQYRSSVFYLTNEQKKIAEELAAILTEKGLEIATQIVPASRFYLAPEQHQDYCAKTGMQPSSHEFVKRF